MSKQLVIFVYPHSSSFIKTDIAILKTRYHVLENTYNWKRKYLIPFYFLHQLFFLLFSMSRSKAVIVSFGGYWAYLPVLVAKLFGKPSYIILHGTDAAALPHMNYGSLRSGLLKKVLKKTYDKATLLLPVSDSLIETSNNFLDERIVDKQGVLSYFSINRSKFRVLYNGIDVDYWKQELGITRNERMALSVISEGQFYLKSGDLIVALAEKMPDIEFRIAGMNVPAEIDAIPSNIQFLGKLSSQSLKQLYSESSIYLQLSCFEGFGCSLCEAMSCGAIPIVSKVNFMPEIVKGNGYVLNHKNVDLLQEVLMKAIDSKDKESIRQKARSKIESDFSLELRSKLLLQLLED